jgi:hypothetical protein
MYENMRPEWPRLFAGRMADWEYHVAMGFNGMGWIHLAQDRYQWWAYVKTVMDLWDPQKAGDVDQLSD